VNSHLYVFFIHLISFFSQKFIPLRGAFQAVALSNPVNKVIAQYEKQMSPFFCRTPSAGMRQPPEHFSTAERFIPAELVKPTA
jgi:hypothetical protein